MDQEEGGKVIARWLCAFGLSSGRDASFRGRGSGKSPALRLCGGSENVRSAITNGPFTAILTSSKNLLRNINGHLVIL